MKLRLLKDIRLQGAPTVQILAGSVCEVTDNTGTGWLAEKIAEPVTVPQVKPIIKKERKDTVTPDEKIKHKKELGRLRVQRFRQNHSVTNNDNSVTEEGKEALHQ